MCVCPKWVGADLERDRDCMRIIDGFLEHKMKSDRQDNEQRVCW